MDMATREDLGLVWMGTGDVLMQPDTSDHIFNQQNDNPFYTDGVQALQSLEDMRQPVGMDGFTVLDELEPYCEESPRFVTSAATQTAQPPGTRKIRPIKHPGLKLKTPIAYQGDTDPSVIPIERDGMAVCEKCGAIGVKHAFYTKERRFCSRACAKGCGEPGADTSNDAALLKVQQQSQSQLPAMQTQNPSLMQNRIPTQLQTQIHPQIQAQIQPQLQAQLQPQMQAQLQSQMQGQLQTQMQGQLQPQMQAQMLQSQMQGQLQSQLQGQLQPQMQGQLQPQIQGTLQPQLQGQMQPQLVPQMQPSPMHLQPQMQQSLQPQIQSQVPMPMQSQVPMLMHSQMQPQMQQSQMHMQPQMQMQHMQLQPHMQMHQQMHIQPQMQIQMQPQIPMQNQGQMQPQMQAEPQKGWCTENNMGVNAVQDTNSCSSSEAGDSTSNPPPQPPPPMSPLPPLQLFEPTFPIDKKNCPDLARTHEWDPQLTEPGFLAAPVSCFNHAPMADSWDNITVGMKVEVQNTDCDNFSEDFPDSFWVATVLKISGYKALLRYEGFGQNSSKDFWVNLCSSLVHHVGWCAIRGRPLIPPKTVEHKYSDWKDFLVKRLTGARTLPSNFYNKVHDSLKSRFRCNLNVEVVDKNRISQVKVATVEKIVGKRLQVRYVEKDDDDNAFWCHEDSALIHPVGWAIRVGHEIEAADDYIHRCKQKIFNENDATDDLFPGQQFQQRLAARQAAELAANNLSLFSQGMKLEAIDPLNLSSICVATVMKVLRDGYIMIRIDSYDADVNCSDWFCYHQTSPCIFPAGFCHANSIPLTPPKGYSPGEFVWSTYLEQSNAIAAPNYLFKQLQEIPHHGFVESMHLEATDIMDPRLVCVATVARVVGRLLKVHFDGWEEEYDQWLDCCSPDIYPVGWCQLVSHKLEGPRVITPPKANAATGKTQRGVRGKRGRRMQKRRTAGGSASGMKKSPGGTLLPLSDSASSATLIGDNDSQSDSQCAVESSGDFGDDDSVMEHNAVLRLVQMDESSVSSNPGGSKLIPRLIDPPANQESGELIPTDWDVNDVAQFLRVNDCAAYCDNFVREEVDGKALLNLTKEQVMSLTGMKVGPSLKISDLIQQLRVRVNPAQERAKASFKKLL